MYWKKAMVRSRQNEDETVIVAASSEESLTEVRDESHPISSQAFPESGNYVLTQREKLSEGIFQKSYRNNMYRFHWIDRLNVKAFAKNLKLIDYNDTANSKDFTSYQFVWIKSV